jgi:hypothetical protein
MPGSLKFEGFGLKSLEIVGIVYSFKNGLCLLQVVKYTGNIIKLAEKLS